MHVLATIVCFRMYLQHLMVLRHNATCVRRTTQHRACVVRTAATVAIASKAGTAINITRNPVTAGSTLAFGARAAAATVLGVSVASVTAFCAGETVLESLLSQTHFSGEEEIMSVVVFLPPLPWELTTHSVVVLLRSAGLLT